jgi:hypothetical protein
MYVRGNPLKYTDPTGHCATNKDGSRSSDDAECWAIADDIYNGWDGNADYWNARFHSKEYFMSNIATISALNKDWMQWQYDQYTGPQ